MEEAAGNCAFAMVARVFEPTRMRRCGRRCAGAWVYKWLLSLQPLQKIDGKVFVLMTYEVKQPGNDGCTMLAECARAPTWSWQDVEDRMVEAMGHWRRSADSEARFALGGRISSIWRMAFTDKLALIEQLGMEAPTPRPLPLSRADIARMAEASEWLRHVPEGDRRLVVLALGKLASGHNSVPWMRLKRQMGVQFGAEGLRKRYSRAITRIANQLNMAEKRQGTLSSPQVTPPSK